MFLAFIGGNESSVVAASSLHLMQLYAHLQ